MQPIKIRSNINNNDILSKLNNVSGINKNDKIESISPIAVDNFLNKNNNGAVEELDFSSENADGLSAYNYDINQEKYIQYLKELAEADKNKIIASGEEYDLSELAKSIFNERNTTIARIAAMSNMELSEVVKLYDLVNENGMTLEYGPLSKLNGWYSDAYVYSGLYAKYTGDNGFSYIVALNKISITDNGVTFSEYDEEELMRYVEGCGSYIKIVENTIENDLTDFFKSQINKVMLANPLTNNISICIADANQGWSGVTTAIGDKVIGTAIQGSDILTFYDPENGRILTSDSYVVGTLLHELGHSFDISSSIKIDEKISMQEPWQEVYPQLVEYLNQINDVKGLDKTYQEINLGDSITTIVSYGKDVVDAENKNEIDSLAPEIFTEINRIYYQDPATLQDIAIDYNSDITGLHYDNLYDFMRDIENGTLVDVD